MEKKPPVSIVVPDDELARQASEVIAAFGYQLYQTVSAWLSLKPGERLLVEIAEDFAVGAGTALTMTQVKRTAASITLRSKGVVALIAALWVFQEANPGKTISAAFLTTSRIGKERGLNFPDRMAGLSYWRVAAREQADIEPIRTALRELALPDSLKSFLKAATADDIRNRILRPIRWYTAAPSAEVLERDLEDRLVDYGQARGVGAQDSRNTLSALVGELLRCARRPPESRYLTAADLVTLFEQHTYRLVPPSLLSGSFSGAADQLAQSALNISDPASIPLPPRAALRQDAVTALHGGLVAEGVSWLHGSSGLGKTTLALLIARRQNAAWQFADLRDLKGNSLRLTLARLATAFGTSGARGLILDDLPPDLDNAGILAMRRVARAVAEADGLLVVTSTKPPAPTLKNSLGVKPAAIRAVPYLAEEDVAEMIGRAGGDQSLWARVVLMSTGGHPQLVDARIMGLQQRGWSKEDRWADILPQGKPKGDVGQERQAVRSRLLAEMDQLSREVLFRLSLLTNNFDRPMALAAAGALQPVAQAGVIFDALIGPWIEQVGPERFRLSQLLRDSGEAALGQELKQAVRGAVLAHLLGEQPFPADQLMQVFILGFALRHVQGLGWFSAALMSTAYRDKVLFKRLAEEVSVFALADRGANEPLFRENLNVSSMLRYAQLLVACALNDFTTALRVLDRAIAEAEKLDGEFKTNTLGLILSSALIERSLPLPPPRWLAMLRRLGELPVIGEMLRQRPQHKDPFSGLIMAVSHEEVLFVARATALTSIDELAQLIDALAKLPTETRDRYLGAATTMARSTTHIVTSAWLSEVKRPGFDAHEAAQTLARLRATATAWADTDIAVEMACAEAVMLDEYADDAQAALAVLAQAKIDYPDDYRINRQRQKIYYRHDRHDDALAEFEIFSTSLVKASPVESAYAFREAGRSAAAINETERARTFFDKAWKALGPSGDHIPSLKAGLSGDCAILSYETGRTDEAIALMTRALTEAENIDPTNGVKEHYCKLILVSALLWMRGARADWPVERQDVVIGMCSNPDPPLEIQDRPLPQPQLVWYELAELEAEVSDKKIALAELRKRTKGGNCLLPMETTLAAHQLQAATRRLDIEGFMESMRAYPRAIGLGAKAFADRKAEDILKMPLGDIKPVAGKEWQEPDIQETVRSAALVFALAATARARHDIYEAFRERCLHTDGVDQATAPLFDLINNPPEQSPDLITSVATVLHQMLDRAFVFDATEATGAIVILVQLLSHHPLGETVAGLVVECFKRVWQDIVTKRTFSMRNPSATGPFILAAFDKGITDTATLAQVALASEAAVQRQFSDELRALLHRIADPVRRSVEYMDFPAKPKP